jgi:hypothetical protein
LAARVGIAALAVLAALLIFHGVRQVLESEIPQPGFVLPEIDAALPPPFTDAELATEILTHRFWHDHISAETLKAFAEQSFDLCPGRIVFVDDRGVVRSLADAQAKRFRETPSWKHRPQGIGEKFIYYDLAAEAKRRSERQALWHLYLSLEIAEMQYPKR